MVKAVFDTNILVSASFWFGNPHQAVALAIDGKVTAATSRALLTELAKILVRDFQLTKEQARACLRTLLDFLEIVKPRETLHVLVKDPEDNRVLECAAAFNADYIVTGDKELLALKEFRRTRIVSAKEFLELV